MSKTTKTAAVALSVKAVGDERKVSFVVSSSGLDRDYERVDVKSLRLPLKGGGYVVAKDLNGSQTVDVPWLLNHSFNVEDVIGSVRVATYDASRDELIFEFGVSKREKAQDMLLLIEEGHLDNAVSITMTDYTYEEGVIYDAELLEVSLVFRGSNKDARLLAVKSLIKGEEMTQVKTLAEKKAELKALTKEIEADEAQAIPEATPTETPEVTPQPEQPEAPQATPAETPVVEAPEEEEDPSKVQPTPEVEEQPPQESKSTKQEKPAMSETIAVKQVKDAPVVVETPVTTKAPQMDKYELAAKQFVAWVNKDSKALAELNQKALDTYKDVKSKATYMNTGVVADGGAIVPSNELLNDVFTTLSNYSTVANDLRVVTLTEGNGLDIATLVTDVVVSEVTTEGGNKPVTKPVLGDSDITLREFAGIAILTKKLVRQAAINVYDLLRDSFARAIANERAVMALTDATSGIVNKTGVVEVETGAAMPTYAELKSMPYQLPVGAIQGSKYYISRELLEAIDSETDTTGRELELVSLSGDGLSGRFKNGFEFAVEEVLGKSGAPHAVFGAMGRFGILLRQGNLESETFDTGTVVDGSSVTHNLLQQNKLAHRVAFYENVGYPLPGAFVKTVNLVA